jgi:hypothetical protein
MDFACIVKLKDVDRYLGSDLKECAREEAPIERKEAAEARAERRFGKAWRIFAEVVEVQHKEWLKHIGSKGGKTVTPIKLLHLRRMRMRSFPKKKWRLTYDGIDYVVVEQSVKHAHKMLTMAGVEITHDSFRRRAVKKQMKSSLPGAESEPGVWMKRNGQGWSKI